MANIENDLALAESHMRNFLLGNSNSLGKYEQHIYPVGKMDARQYEDLPPNINRYMRRSVSIDIISGESDIYIYTKIPSFIILGVVESQYTSEMLSSKVEINGGEISSNEYYFPPGIGGYIFDCAEKQREAYSKIKDEDKQKFQNFILNNKEKVTKSKLFEAILLDYQTFGVESTLDPLEKNDQ